MKIAYNSSIFFLQKHGGISRYFCSIIKEFLEDNKSIKVFSPIFKNDYLLNVPKKYRSGFYIPRYPVPPFLKNIVDQIAFKQIQRSNFDIVHDTYYSENLLDYKNKRKIITVYDLIHEKFPDLYKNRNFEKKKKIINCSDEIICISENTKNDLIKYYNIEEKKINVIYLGCNHIQKNFHTVEQNNYVIPKNFIFFVGSRLKYKNFNLLLNTFHMSKKLRNDFNIVCFGGGAFTENEKKLFDELNIMDKLFHFEGNDDLLSYLYTKAKLFVFPSQYEGFGIPLLEAMSIGCPVLASNTSIFKEICKDGAHYFKNNDTNDLSEKLEQLVYSETNLLSKIDIALHISKIYNWKKCANETYKIYCKI